MRRFCRFFRRLSGPRFDFATRRALATRRRALRTLETASPGSEDWAAAREDLDWVRQELM